MMTTPADASSSCADDVARTRVLYLHAQPDQAPRFCVALLGTRLVAFDIAEWKQLLLDSRQQPAAAATAAATATTTADDDDDDMRLFLSAMMMTTTSVPEEEAAWPQPRVSFCGGRFATSTYIRQLIAAAQLAPEGRAAMEELLRALCAAATALQARLQHHEQTLAQIMRASETLRGVFGHGAVPHFQLQPDIIISSSHHHAPSSLWMPSGTLPTASPVLPPCGTIETPSAAQALTTAATSKVLPGRTTARARPWARFRQSCS